MWLVGKAHQLLKLYTPLKYIRETLAKGFLWGGCIVLVFDLAAVARSESLSWMGIPDHLICLLRNLYAGQETTVLEVHGSRIAEAWLGEF